MFQFASAGQIVFGAGAANELPRLVRGLGARAWLVLGRARRHEAAVRRLLDGAGVAVEVASVAGEPTRATLAALRSSVTPRSLASSPAALPPAPTTPRPGSPRWSTSSAFQP